MVPVGAPLVLLGLACAAAGPESARRRLGTSGGLTRAAAEQMAESGKFGQYHDWQSVTRADSKIMVIKDFKARLVSDASGWLGDRVPSRWRRMAALAPRTVPSGS